MHTLPSVAQRACPGPRQAAALLRRALRLLATGQPAAAVVASLGAAETPAEAAAGDVGSEGSAGAAGEVEVEVGCVLGAADVVALKSTIAAPGAAAAGDNLYRCDS